MYKKVVVLLLFLWVITPAYSQSIEEIKADRENYIWGEGSGISLKKADQEALSMLISQISTHVESSFSLLKEELKNNGVSKDFKEVCNSVVKTYSNATLKNTERIILGNEPDAVVFRYIKQSEVAKVFAERKDKIIGFVINAEKAKSKNMVADALRYYYWSLCLLKSHPDGGKIRYTDNQQKQHLLATWLPLQINNIFSGIDIDVAKVDKKENECDYTLNIKYNNKPVENFDYSFWDGMDYSNLISARNGIGLVELYGMSSKTDKLKLKAEYIFEGEARIDRELEDVISKIDPIPFRKSYFTINLNEPVGKTLTIQPKEKEKQNLTIVKEDTKYRKNIDSVLNAIKTKNYVTVKNLFTKDGYNIYNKIIRYGNAKIVGDENMQFVANKDEIICRSVSMRFNFKTNNKQFIEDVVFHLNKDAKIKSLSLGLSQAALHDILDKNMWKEADRLALINFLENYKTAYALKRIDYIENIFSDDALIITGTLVKVKPNEACQFKNNRIIKYNRQTKQQYVKNLRYSFSSKEYINIKFENSEIRKAGKGGDIFGVQIKQNYFSSNYGDTGYLFLIVDLNNTEEPVIHVRTWQPEITTNDKLYDLSNFN